MVFIAPFIGAAALLSGFASALPMMADSSTGQEVAVSAPEGTPVTDTAELSRQSASEAAGAYGDSAQWATTQAWNAYETPAAVHETPAAAVYETTQAAHETSAALATAVAYSSPSYGSGSYGGSGYDDCVQQCIASFGAPAATYAAPTATAASEGSVGTGATHTVIVAPTQGVLRYVPFALNASVGDTIKFMWGANNHTVTKGSALTPCNKSSDALFASGTQNKDFVFTQVVNTTDPTFYYCATPTHCQKGMFGIVNPPNAAGAPTSMGAMMSQMKANNSDVAAYAAYVDNMTVGSKAATWGTNLDMSAVPDWAQPMMAENVLYTRSLLAANPDILKDDGSIDLSNMASTPMMIPEDVSAAINAAASSPSSAVSSAAAAPSASASEAADPVGAAAAGSNGAGALASPKMLVALMAVVATVLAL